MGFNGDWQLGGGGVYYCDISIFRRISEIEKRRLPAVWMAVTGILVGVAVEAVVVPCFWSVEGGLRSGSAPLGLVFLAVSLASPLSSFTEEDASAGKEIPLLAEPPRLSGT